MHDAGKGDKRRPEDTEAFASGYDRIFGDKRPARGHYVWDSDKKEFVPFKEAVTQNNGPAILPDIQPYQSMVTGEMITSRSKHREHLRQHNLIEVGNEKQTPQAKELPKGLKETIARQVYEKLRY